MPQVNPQVDANTVGLKYSHQVANGTFTVTSGPGVLDKIVVNTAGVTDTITVYDNIAGSGNVIAVINDTLAGDFVYDIAFTIGLTLVIAGTTPPDITVAYRL